MDLCWVEDYADVYLRIGWKDALFEVRGENVEDLSLTGSLVPILKPVVLELKVDEKRTA